MRSQRSPQPLARFGWHNRVDEALARCSDQNRQIKSTPDVKPRDAGKALFGRLAEADPRIEHDLLAWQAGIAREQIVLDPGIGFGKTPEQSLACIAISSE